MFLGERLFCIDKYSVYRTNAMHEILIALSLIQNYNSITGSKLINFYDAFLIVWKGKKGKKVFIYVF